MKIANPADGTVITEITADNASAVSRKYELARGGQPKWAKTPLRARLAAIAAFREQTIAKRETLARTLTLEVGKPINQSRNELNGLLARIDFFLAESARAARGRLARTRSRSSRNGSRTNRLGSSPTFRRGTTRISSAATSSFPPLLPATRCSTSPPNSRR
jgi:acyl-CoA reductase-like NAD-dependent aldehyde dehydrogenase